MRRGLCRFDCGCEGPWECTKPKAAEPDRVVVHVVHHYPEPRAVAPPTVVGEVIEEED